MSESPFEIAAHVLRAGEVLASIEDSPAFPVVPVPAASGGIELRVRRSVLAWFGVWVEAIETGTYDVPTSRRFEWIGDRVRIYPHDYRSVIEDDVIEVRPGADGRYSLDDLGFWVLLDETDMNQVASTHWEALEVLASDSAPHDDDAMVRYLAQGDDAEEESVREAIERGGAVTPLAIPDEFSTSPDRRCAVWTLSDADETGRVPHVVLQVLHRDHDGYSAQLCAVWSRQRAMYVPIDDVPAATVGCAEGDTFDAKTFETFYEDAFEGVRTRFCEGDTAVSRLFNVARYLC